MSITEIIKYEGDNETFIWKHPCVDFNTMTQLIVHESQEALFYMNGKALDLFGPGRYTLTTQNIPVLSKFTNMPTDGRTPFHCEVYFINKTEQLAIKWGTDSKIQYIEPTYNFPLEIGVSGEMSLSIVDSRKLLVKIVGTEKMLQRQQLVNLFRTFLLSKVKTYIAQSIRTNKINIFEIDEKLESFSEDIKKRLDEDFLKYGVSLDSFLVTSIVKPDGNPRYEKFKELHFRKYMDVAEAELKQKLAFIEQQTKLQQSIMESEGIAQKIIMESQGIAQKRAAEGYTYQQEHGFKVAEKIAMNDAISPYTNIGIGLGTMASVGGFIAGTVKESMNSVNHMFSSANSKHCIECGEELIPNASFCDNCGIKIATNSCSNCGFVFVKQSKYCPVCGAKKEVVNNER